MKTPIVKVSLAFANGMPDNTLITFCRNVRNLLYSLAAYTGIPITGPELDLKIDSFSTAKAAQPSGGKAATADKDDKRDELIAPMKTLAAYVQENCGNNLALLLATGFEAISTNRTRYPLSKPSILKISSGMTGEALVTITKENVARGCEVRVAEIDDEGKAGEFIPPIFSTSSRNITVPNLIPGRLYLFQGRTLGGTTTYSDWSDPLVQRAA